jgi:hypothetical protein
MYTIPAGFPPDYMKEWHLICWIAIIGIMYLFAIILSIRVGRAETPITKWIFRAFSWFLWIYGITNITIILSIWFPDSFDFWQGIANFAGLLSLVAGVAVLEKYLVPKTHHVLTVFAIIINVVDLLILLFFPDQTDLSLTIAQVGAVILLASIIGLYFVFIHQSTGTIRRQAVITVTGIALCGIGAIFNGYQILELGMPLLVAPLLFGIGVVFIGTSLKISKEA